MITVTIELYSHFFRVLVNDYNLDLALQEFSKRFIHWKKKWNPRESKHETQKGETFFIYPESKDEYRIHINYLDQFKSFLQNNHYVRGYTFQWVNIPLYTPSKIKLHYPKGYSLRPYQEPAVAYLNGATGTEMVTKSSQIIRLTNQRSLALGTGRGKSLCLQWLIATLSQKVLMCIRPQYTSKWKKDFAKLGISNSEIMVVEGGDQLRALCALSQQDLKAIKIFIISNKTLTPWLKRYNTAGALAWKGSGELFEPQHLCTHLGVGLMAVDEIHQDFHFNALLLMHMHVPLSVGLSATLLSDDAFIQRMQEGIFPLNTRFDDTLVDPYINAVCYRYHLRVPYAIREKRWATNQYSHDSFEKGISKYQETLGNYQRMIARIIEIYHLSDPKKGSSKVLIYVTGVDFAQRLVTFLKYYFKDRIAGDQIRKYTSGDPQTNLHEPMIRVSTLGSASTNHDIDNLSTTIMTVALSSTTANLQAYGRLRDENDIPKTFIYLTCADFKTHLDYDDKKRKLLRMRALTLNQHHHEARV